ncbi:peptidoglycan-binding protein [Streptomyces daliensis]|uniref:Peptidoglycan-binding protein n=1 Tax=Streptomyces daliensis TaxID=299421 RepID=A0A8T4ISR0_9ACTN|nr:peptidoglycan-binding protein [Streptomyces daliensis]
MSDDTPKQRLKDMLDDIDGMTLFFPGLAGVLLAQKVSEALGVSEPDGDPGHIDGKSKAYNRAAVRTGTVHGDVNRVGNAGLPETWVGKAGSKAVEVTSACAYTADQMSEKFAHAGKELSLLAEGIRDAQSAHGRARPSLHRAKEILGDDPGDCEREELEKARTALRDGVQGMYSAACTAESAGRRAARELNKMASEARAGKLSTGDLSDADRITLAAAAAAGGDREDNEILTANDLRRSAEYMDKMSPEDERKFRTLLDSAKSPEERAYLMKALASGRSLEEVTDFRNKIHPYGADTQWLQQHLTPIVNESDQTKKYGDQESVWFGYGDEAKKWEQTGPTCVALSTVTARAQSDPLFALDITTGGHPGDPAYDTPEKFAERLEDEQNRVYDERDGWNGFWGQDGMDDDERVKVANQEIAPRTGEEYERRGLDDAQSRRDALPDIQEAVNEGKPVPVSVSGPDSAHQMMIIGQEGDKLQIYNPWGTTSWVSEDDFVNNRMQGASDDRLPDVDDVVLPKD